MKMIIDIPEGMLKAIKDGYWSGSHKLELAIRNGTPYEERPQDCSDDYLIGYMDGCKDTRDKIEKERKGGAE